MPLTTMSTVVDSLAPFFSPRSVAVVGAGRRRGGIGAEIFHNLRANGFRGSVFPINPNATHVDSVQAYASVNDIPGPVDLAVIAVPAAVVERAVEQCIAKRVRAIVIVTAGFAETGEPGRAVEARLRERVRSAGIRLIGPNCMGLLNTDPATSLNATFSPVFPPAGPIAFSSQSGALGLAILEYAQRLNLGLSSFVSVGNKADVSSNDLLEYWEQDPRTGVVLLYLESFGNPRRFGEIARRVGKTKPIVAVKAGRSASGARAASSHTGALASNDVVVDALFREAGVIRTDTMEELFDVAALLAHQPIPAGPRVAVLTNAGGPGIMAADACEAAGLTLPSLAPVTLDALRSFLPVASGLSNPIDMLATAAAHDYERAIPLLLTDPNIDSLMIIFIPPLVTNAIDVAHAIARSTRGSPKPVLSTFFGAEGVGAVLQQVPCYAFPEAGVRALGRAVGYSHWKRLPLGARPLLERFDIARAEQIVQARVAEGGGWLPPRDCVSLLEACGIDAAPVREASSREQVAAIGREFGYPLAMKGCGPQIIHKTEAHAVATGLTDEASAFDAYDRLHARPDVTEVLIQPMVGPGVEMIVGASRDPAFGHVVLCGSGGIQVELQRDAACRLAPLTDMSAARMLDEIRGIALLRGFRGRPKGDEAGLKDILLRVSELVSTCPDILEIDLNPVIVTPQRCCVVDARIKLAGSW